MIILGQMPPQPHAEYSTDTVIYKGGPLPPANMRGPLPAADDEFPPPPPLRSADTSLNDSNSTTQSNLTSECSEAECDREPLVRESKGQNLGADFFIFIYKKNFPTNKKGSCLM